MGRIRVFRPQTLALLQATRFSTACVICRLGYANNLFLRVLDARLHSGDIVRLWTIPVSVSLDGSGHQQAMAALAARRLCAEAGWVSTRGLVV